MLKFLSYFSNFTHPQLFVRNLNFEIHKILFFLDFIMLQTDYRDTTQYVNTSIEYIMHIELFASVQF